MALFSSLSERLNHIFSKLTKHGKLTELEIKGAMREVRIALLEADVNIFVAKKFIADVSEKAVGQELSFVGMPMPDGSNGSVMDPSSPVGVFAGSEKPDGCREFVKYLLLSYDMSYHRDKNSALPMYRPYLEKLEAEAVSEGRMTAEEVERFESFLASVENSTLVDERLWASSARRRRPASQAPERRRRPRG